MAYALTAERGTFPLDLSDPSVLLANVRMLRDAVHENATATISRWRPFVRRRAFVASAINLAHYLALRHHDLRHLQSELVPWGLSSLGRSESRVLANLDAVLATLASVCGKDPSQWPRPPRRAFARGERRLRRNADELFGAAPEPRHIRIMVTLPSEAATDEALVGELVRRGMDCARINCAHDDQTAWDLMLRNVRSAAAAAKRQCAVLMDLGGPKLRIVDVRTPQPKHRVVGGDRILLVGREFADLGRFPVQVRSSVASLPDTLKVGAAVWIDDGRLGTEVHAREPEGVVLVARYAQPKGLRLAADKGMNVPGTTLGICPLTSKDLADLDFIARRADIVGYSFVQEAADIALLQEELRVRLTAGTPLPPMIAKIETERAVANLPAMILQAAGQQPFGVMIARGDLAVEIGYERLAEIQEEMLWLCEAAHVPVIWATQVLERLVKKGMPSRAEMTDAAMSQRADCVMLNKGPFVADAVTVLDHVLSRMQAHQQKKSSLLRALHVWDSVGEPVSVGRANGIGLARR
jgi:pyruvate kinase